MHGKILAVKNYFYFSRGQKFGVLVLLCLITLFWAINWLSPYVFESEKMAEDSRFMQEVAAFKSSLKDRESVAKYKKNDDFLNKKLFQFDPNTLDSAGFVSLGIKPKIAHNILKYRSKSGKFKRPEDFAKTYGISESQFKELLPYISIAKQEKTEKTSDIETFKEKKTYKEKPVLLVELNAADTIEMKKIPGIGSVFAHRIVEYRKKLGGFADKKQLKEVYGIKPEVYDKIEEYITVNAQNIRKIDINKMDVERLIKHPYLRFYAAKSIYEQRCKLGKLTSGDDLKNLKDLPEETLEKILPYLSFE